MNAPAIRSIGLSKTYRDGDRPVEALRDVTFDVHAGEMLALRGPSGAGKSTLIALVACADRPSAGRLEVRGVDVTRISDRALRRLRRRDVGVVFQHFHLLAGLTVGENVALPLALLGRSHADIGARVDRALAEVGLVALSERYPAHLSGGQAQRVAIARAAATDPAIVLADEPTGNLDPENGSEIVRLLRAMADAGKTVVVATHAASVAAACDRTLWLRDATVVADQVTRPSP